MNSANQRKWGIEEVQAILKHLPEPGVITTVLPLSLPDSPLIHQILFGSPVGDLKSSQLYQLPHNPGEAAARVCRIVDNTQQA